MFYLTLMRNATDEVFRNTPHFETISVGGDQVEDFVQLHVVVAFFIVLLCEELEELEVLIPPQGYFPVDIGD